MTRAQPCDSHGVPQERATSVWATMLRLRERPTVPVNSSEGSGDRRPSLTRVYLISRVGPRKMSVGSDRVRSLLALTNRAISLGVEHERWERPSSRPWSKNPASFVLRLSQSIAHIPRNIWFESMPPPPTSSTSSKYRGNVNRSRPCLSSPGMSSQARSLPYRPRHQAMEANGALKRGIVYSGLG